MQTTNSIPSQNQNARPADASRRDDVKKSETTGKMGSADKKDCGC